MTTWLHTAGNAIRNVLIDVPLSAVRLLFVGTLVAVLLWVILLPRTRTQPDGGARRWDENLKIPACIALGFQVVIYLIL